MSFDGFFLCSGIDDDFMHPCKVGYLSFSI